MHIINSISTFVGYLMSKPSFLEGQEWYYLTHNFENKRGHIFHESIIRKWM